MDIVNEVYTTLQNGTQEISEDLTALEQVESDIKSNRYSHRAITDELLPKREELQMRINSRADRALSDARKLVTEYEQTIADRETLNPDELTDDVKLFAPGINLTSRDIEGIMRRNSKNPTMLQIAQRYAQANNIPLSVGYAPDNREKESAQNLKDIISIYGNWIKKPGNRIMLDQFFDFRNRK